MRSGSVEQKPREEALMSESARQIREIVVISGKGGAGKTSVTAALAHLSGPKIVCDLDVDAPDLHMLLAPERVCSVEFHSGNEAVIDTGRCTGCGQCADLCRFEAIYPTAGGAYAVAPLRCEGCKVCVSLCPEEAIDFPVKHCGDWYVSETRFGSFVHAQLYPGEENSGRLVTLLKQEARKLAEADGMDTILCDGAPGIGCPVISSLAGTTLCVLVTEPTPSGRHDLERVAELCAHFKTPVAVIINKYDLNPKETARIEAMCKDKGHPVVCHLPFDPDMTQAMLQARAVSEHSPKLRALLQEAWQRIDELAVRAHGTASA